jgi:hypothetical protein
MAHWRRLCVDVDDAGRVLGASIEHYGDRGVGPDAISVWAGIEWRGLNPPDLMTRLLESEGHQAAFDFEPEPDLPSY